VVSFSGAMSAPVSVLYLYCTEVMCVWISIVGLAMDSETGSESGSGWGDEDEA